MLENRAHFKRFKDKNKQIQWIRTLLAHLGPMTSGSKGQQLTL